MTKQTEVYTPPDQAADFSIRNIGEGEIILNTTLVGTPTQIGETKRVLFLIIKALDRVAVDWGVPNDLNSRGVKIKLMKRNLKL
jgi:hypothetical protein